MMHLEALETSPLDRASNELRQHLSCSRPLFFKREDLLKPGGGNKVRRFKAFFKQYGYVNRVTTLSDPGSHTFQILKHFAAPKGTPGAGHLVFLETNRTLTPYTQKGQESYVHHPQITVKKANMWQQYATYLLSKSTSSKGQTIGIGGHVKLPINPFTQAIDECLQQLVLAGIDTQNVDHLFPISSGNMMEGFLHHPQSDSQNYYALMTGDKWSIPYLKYAYLRKNNVHLLPVYQNDTYNQLQTKILTFHERSNINLDPIHTVHMLDVFIPKKNHPINKDTSKPLVCWITCPLQTNSY